MLETIWKNIKMAKQNLKFYDLKKKKSFYTTNYKIFSKKSTKGTRYFAETTAPSGSKSTRLISKDLFKELKWHT